MIIFFLVILGLFLCLNVEAATDYVCNTAQGAGNGSSEAACKAAGGTTFSNVTPGAGDTVYICGDTGVIRGTLTITSTNNVTVDLGCNGGTSGTITGTDIVTSFTGPDGNGEYTSTDTFTTPHIVIVDGVIWKEGVKGSLADNEWAFNSAIGGTQAILLGSDPAGHTVEVARRTHAIEFVTSTGGAVTGGRIYGTRTDGNAAGTGAINFDASSGTVTNTSFYAVRKAVDFTGTASGTVTGTTINYCGDGLDANQNTNRPTNIRFENNTIENCDWQDWWTNTQTSHSVTVDGEGIACTNCGDGLVVSGNTIKKTNKAISTRINSAANHQFIRNYIEDTNDEAIDPGCTNSSGIPNVTATGNIIVRAGSGGGYLTSSYGFSSGTSACGNGVNILFANNSIVDSANGWIIGAAASQTGTITVSNNAVVNVDPTGVSGTHYFANWNSVNASHSMTLSTNYNRYYQTMGTGFYRWIAGASARAYSAFSSYKTDSSQEAASTQGDPRWLGGLSPTTKSGFRLDANSVMRRTGLDLSLGNIQDQGNRAFAHPPSIGAWEAASGDIITNNTRTNRN